MEVSSPNLIKAASLTGYIRKNRFSVTQAGGAKDLNKTSQQATSYQINNYGNSPKVVTPNVFIGGPVRVSPGFPLKTCRNDSLLED
jgi:hypothetical protein